MHSSESFPMKHVINKLDVSKPCMIVCCMRFTTVRILIPIIQDALVRQRVDNDEFL